MLSLLLVTLWFPATMHCALESANALPHWASCQTAAKDADHCSGDPCATVETALAKQTNPTLKLSEPDVLACACLVCLFAQPDIFSTHDSRALTGRAFGPAAAWISNWQFVRRAAPLPGAPASLLA